MRARSQDTPKLVIESAAFGLGYMAFLVWIGSALVGSFGVNGVAPYWSVIPQLRTDTAGAIAFAVAAASFSVSRYLQLRRHRGGAPAQPLAARPSVLAVQAVAETAAVLCTGVVIYLSLNAVTHPWTLRVQLTHLLSWPSEGTVRVIALCVCLVATALARFTRAACGCQQVGQPAAVSQTDVTARGRRAGLRS